MSFIPRKYAQQFVIVPYNCRNLAHRANLGQPKFAFELLFYSIVNQLRYL